jgi:hypothetical protein
MASWTVFALRSPGRWTSTTKRVVALDQGGDLGAAGPSEDEISLPVAKDSSVLDLGGTFGDEDRVDDAATRSPAGVRSLLCAGRSGRFVSASTSSARSPPRPCT